MTTDLQRPATVQWAANCLWVSAASALVATLLEAAAFVQVPGAPAGMSAVVGFITALFTDSRQHWLSLPEDALTFPRSPT